MNSISNCEHQEYRDVWVDDTCESDEGRWEKQTVSTTEDLDLHRYHCTQCGDVMYYSNAARDYYENGIASDVPGLSN